MNNSMVLCTATVTEALQEYFDRRFVEGARPKVTGLKVTHANAVPAVSIVLEFTPKGAPVAEDPDQ